MRARSVPLALALWAGAFSWGCEGGGLPDGLGPDTPLAGGPRIVWDVAAEPLPELPLPNDVATWPDPTSPTGRRLNVSMVAPTGFEGDTRALFDRVDGWGTYGALTVSFDAPIDVQELYDRQGGSGNWSEDRWGQHAVYLVDLETGHPVPLDVNGGNMQYVLDSPSNYWVHDPHAGESNLLFETREEDLNGNGVLDPGEDTDFDGVLDHPNTFSRTANPDPAAQVDETLWFYDRETETLILKPILPLEQERTYAVVITDRLVGEDGEPVRSPFEHRHHVAQKQALESLTDVLAASPSLYGDLATRGWDGIAFAWTFTTQSVTRDLDTIRDGLYGRGSMAWLAEEFPARYAPAVMQGGGPSRVDCAPPGVDLYIAPREPFMRALDTVVRTAFELDPDQAQTVLDSYANLSHLAIAFIDTPYFLGDPHLEPGERNVNEVFEMDYQSGEARVAHDTLSLLIFVPKESETARQPFPTAFYVHGYGSNSAEPLPFAGFMLQNGVAAVMVNAEGHGLVVPDGLDSVVAGFFESECLKPTYDAFSAGRASDINQDGEADSGADFWTAYLFHTRDVVRQTIIDHVRAIQVLRSFDGRPAEPATFDEGPVCPVVRGTTSVAESLGKCIRGEEGQTDQIVFDGRLADGSAPAVAGDFDGNGVPDLGGPDNSYFFTGGSLGGIMSGIVGGVEPAVRAAAPIVGAGGLTDVAVRTDNGGVLNAMHMRMMGPFVVTRVSDGPGDRTACAAGDVSLQWLTNDLASRHETEFACLPPDLLDEDDVMVVRNLINREVACAGATRGVAASYRVPIATDPGHLVQVEIYQDAVMDTDFGTCTFRSGDRVPDRVVDTWEVGNGRRGDGVCQRCATYQDRTFEVGEPLVALEVGFGNRRQSPDLRRLLYLAQHGLDPGDPINYARRVFLDPVTAEDVTPRPRSLFVVNSIGDQNVPLSAGNAYARAAGVLPFMPPDAPDIFADYRAPAWFAERYDGLASPNDLLIAYHVLEGVDRLGRHPIPGGPANFLFDVDDVAEGRFRFQADGRHQTTADEAWVQPRLETPLRWVRETRAVTGPDDDPWQPGLGVPISGLLNNYAIPAGVHGFDEIVYTSDTPFDPAQYLINLISRYGATDGTDLRYHSDPGGHLCLEDSSCDFLAR